MTSELLDVLIVGAGLSGIGAAVHLKKNCPERSFAILEGRTSMGGTWDLFRYPGIRSDSDMYTLGYSFKPWTNPKAIADGPSILEYIRETADEHNLTGAIRFGHRVKSAEWSDADSLWDVGVETKGEIVHIRCRFLWVCGGYYNYEHGYSPKFADEEKFGGVIIHPQHWPQDLDYSGKRVVVIGSGATAITLVPSMAEKAAHVTMLQRSPTYVVSLPSKDRIAGFLRSFLPESTAYHIVRWKNVLFGMLFYNLSRSKPQMIKNFIVGGVRRALKPGYEVEKHFAPRYNPWDQRVCVVPDSDLFEYINTGKVAVVTNEIEKFTAKGILLKSGQEIEADVVVRATGLDLLALGGIGIRVNGEEVVLNKRLSYRGMMIEGVPNLAFVLGYTNASWTLKADLVSEYVCRLLNHMKESGLKKCSPEMHDSSVTGMAAFDFTSGYVQRGIDRFPQQGTRKPWRLHQNYAKDIMMLRHGSLDDGVLEFK